MIGENLLRFNKEQKYVLLDCETCNLNLMDTNNVPWQWAWNIATIDGIISRHNYFVKWPVIDISRDAARMTGFYQRTIDEEGISPQEALQKLEEVLFDPQYKIVIHNGLGFDIYLHTIHRRLMGKDADYSYLPRVIDTMVLARAFKLGVQPKPNENLLVFQYKFNNTPVKGIKTSIRALCDDYGFPYDDQNAHDARWDVDILFQIFQRFVKQIEI